jgi:hypothetical protein
LISGISQNENHKKHEERDRIAIWAHPNPIRSVNSNYLEVNMLKWHKSSVSKNIQNPVGTVNDIGNEVLIVSCVALNKELMNEVKDEISWTRINEEF